MDGKTYSPAALLRKYDDQKQWRRQLYLPVFGENMIDGILDEMRTSYAAVIPHMPFIGRHNYHLQWVMPNAEKLADYLIAKDYGVTIAQFTTLHLAQAASDSYDKYSEQQRRQIGKGSVWHYRRIDDENGGLSLTAHGLYRRLHFETM